MRPRRAASIVALRRRAHGRRRRTLLAAGVAVAVVAASACGDEPVAPEPLPTIADVRLAQNDFNVLSGYATASVRGADSVAVLYHLDDAANTPDSITPAVRPVGDTVTVPILGMRPGRRYAVRVIAYHGADTTFGEPREFITGQLPADIPRFDASGIDPSPGLVLLGAGRYVVVIDNAGEVVWYRRFPGGVGLNVMAQPTGRYVLRPPTAKADDVEPWLELDAMGYVRRQLHCAGDLPSRPHDIVLEENGSYLLLCDEVRTMDLSAHGGSTAARVTATAVQRIGPTGALRFHWSAFDHFAITDLPARERSGPAVNWTHGNAIDVDADGNFVVSFRNLGEVAKIDARTGDVLWRLGGVRNEFTFVGTDAPAFARQHSARIGKGGTVVLLDNLGDPAESRAEHYVLDERNRVARLIRSYGSRPRVVTEIGGSVQPLAHGRTLVSFGTAGRVEEYDAAGNTVWRIEGNPGYVFRAQRIRSLYAPGVGTAR